MKNKLYKTAGEPNLERKELGKVLVDIETTRDYLLT